RVSGRRSLQAYDELRRMRAPIDWDDVGTRVRGADLVRIVRDDGWDRNHEILAEIAACIPGNRIRHFADEILDVLVARVRFLHAYEQHGQHAAGRGEINDALARSGNADHAGVFEGPGIAVRDQIRRSDARRLLCRGLE